MLLFDFVCESFGFETPTVMGSYFEPGDCVDVVLQNSKDATFRVVRWHNVSEFHRRGDSEAYAKAEAKYADENKSEDEQFIGKVWEMDDEQRLECPSCHKMTVRRRGRGIASGPH